MGSPVEFAGYTYRVSQKILTTGRCCGAKFAHGHNLGAIDTDLVLVRKGQKKFRKKTYPIPAKCCTRNKMKLF